MRTALLRALCLGFCVTAASGFAAVSVAGPAAAESKPDPADNAGKRATGFSLSVEVTQLRNDEGRVAVALFDSADDFPKQERAFAGKVTSIRDRRAVVRFEGLRPGIYAVAVLHDENANSKMDFNFVGIPLEGYGFSNDASAPFGPPSFEDAAFRLKARPSALPVRIRYFWR